MSRPLSRCCVSHALQAAASSGSSMDRGLIGTIIGVLVVIILVIVILQLV
jgi:hypothetical protein